MIELWATITNKVMMRSNGCTISASVERARWILTACTITAGAPTSGTNVFIDRLRIVERDA